MHNNLIYIVWIIVDLFFLLTAFSIWGRIGIIAVIAANVIMMNIFVLKGMVLFGIDATGGNVLYASIFLGTDILSEYYGQKEARQAVLLGFFISLLFLISSRFILLFEPASWDLYHVPMEQLFTPVWRIIAASMAAYIVSQNLDVISYELIRRRYPKQLWLRNNGSTWTSQAVDSIIFCTAAFAGTYETKVVLGIILSTYILKVIVAALDTPFIYLTRVITRHRPSLIAG